MGLLIIFCFMPQGDGIIDDADPEQPESEAAVTHYVWQLLASTNSTKQRKADPRLLFACFLTKPTVAAALPEPLHISWDVLSWAKTKQEYSHVLQSTKKDDDRRAALMTTGEQL